ncbi:MAG: hypothetical protein V1789_12100 [PVC group bacterium]
MDDRLIVGWGYNLLKVLLVLLVVAGIVFLAITIIKRIPPDIEKHRPQLDLLEKAYEMRRKALEETAELKVRNAPNEILAIQYQQDLSINLSETEQLYFADRQAVIDSNYGVLEEHWLQELESIHRGVGEDAPPPPEQ